MIGPNSPCSIQFPCNTATKWLLRQDAIKSITAFIESGQLDEKQCTPAVASSCILVVVKEHTRGFKETNVNIMKAIFQLFLAVCGYHESKEQVLPTYLAEEGARLTVAKLSDKKLSSLGPNLLSALCVVCQPFHVLEAACAALENAKAPLAHEEFLRWFQAFCVDFGVSAGLGAQLGKLIPWLLSVSFSRQCHEFENA